MLHDAGLMDSMLYKNLQHLRDANSAPDRGLIDLDSVLQTVRINSPILATMSPTAAANIRSSRLAHQMQRVSTIS